ncbi:hypothetical protein A8709_19150 [Paenibacillus pectinilyticus]|uniref:RNA polymerase sigma-70 region 2 domain-containing protein n=1 Tax=Paenibacillus pectinilyticus TaxID=512399 RepID=A0A1C0ZZZ2_9BACL|nr:sigma-70 family RNA polymerase sigma factor [Paenibacillus pectinilyticus]OCT13704.1 hypothetical protein A8709_19150 [Paenibacillus pectinilyticus]
MEKELDLPELIRLVKDGDQAALSLLINRFQSVALSWSKAIVRDEHIAEDVVQEAFLRLTSHIQNLQDDEKFTAWFRLMVRRLSMNAIRGAAHQREWVTDELPEEEWNEELKDEEQFRNALDHLSKQAKDVLTVSAYEEASPDELAVRFGMNKSNVYNVLSRARVKANEERFRHEISRYLQVRREKNLPTGTQLANPNYKSPYAFLSIMLGEALHFAEENKTFTYTELMGISGEAFRLNVATGCRWQGISTFDWSYSANQTLERLGIAGSCFGRPQRTTITPEQLVHMLSLIHMSLDKGIPVIVRNQQINEWGYITGYSDPKQLLRYMGCNGTEQTLRYDQLGRTGEEQPLFILAIKGRSAPAQTGLAALRAIAAHARGKEPALEGYAFGLTGYPHWIDAVQSGALDLHGHAYQVAILAEARLQAAKYLQLLSETMNRHSDKLVLVEAAACYRNVSEVFRKLYPSFPFGYGGSSAGRLEAIQRGLQAAWESERQGIERIQSIL